MATTKERCKVCDGDGESRDAHFAGQPCEGCGGTGLVSAHPTNKERTCASFFTVRGEHKEDCPCHFDEKDRPPYHWDSRLKEVAEIVKEDIEKGEIIRATEHTLNQCGKTFKDLVEYDKGSVQTVPTPTTDSVEESLESFISFIKPFKNRAYTEDTAKEIERRVRSLLQERSKEEKWGVTKAPAEGEEG